MKLGEKVRFFRKKSNLSKKQLAGMVGATEESIKKYEDGQEMPSAEMLKEISHRLHISPIYFFESEEKELLLFPMDYKEFQKWCRAVQLRYTNPFLDVNYFEYSIKSDRYFIELTNRYLIRLEDGFYFIPIVPKWHSNKHYRVLDIEQMRKVLNEDVVLIEREIRRKNLFRIDGTIFAKEVYVSKYDHVDPIYLSDEEENELFEISSYCNHIVGYNENLSSFYLLETNGINQIPLTRPIPQGILNEKKIYLNVKEKRSLTTPEVKQLIFYVLNEEEFIRRIRLIMKKEVHSETKSLELNSNTVFYNLETLEKQEKIHENDYRAIAHFLRVRYWAVDNIKRMLYLTQELGGSIFTNEWEIAPYVAPSKEKEKQVSIGEKENNELSILLAEDSTFMRSILINILKRHFSCNVDEAKDGESALRTFETKRKLGENYDLILLDITMPKLDGFTLLKQIMRQDKNATVIMCSSVTNKKIVVESVRNGAKHFITKPIEEKDMISIIKKVLSKKD